MKMTPIDIIMVISMLALVFAATIVGSDLQETRHQNAQLKAELARANHYIEYLEVKK